MEETKDEKTATLPVKAHLAPKLELKKAIFAKKLPDNEHIERNIHATFDIVPPGARTDPETPPGE